MERVPNGKCRDGVKAERFDGGTDRMIPRRKPLNGAPAAGGLWTETILHDFRTTVSDGNFPETSLVMDSHGNLYGTTTTGGTGNEGTVFEVTP
jgi:uncharacterized repeat protein (TIGR03803 family)